MGVIASPFQTCKLFHFSPNIVETQKNCHFKYNGENFKFNSKDLKGWDISEKVFFPVQLNIGIKKELDS